MRATDHFRLIRFIFSQSIFASVATLALLILAASGFVFDLVLDDDQKKISANMVREFFSYWEHLLVFALLILVWVLYRRLVPRVAIEFNDGGQFSSIKDGVRTYKVELVNYGEWQNHISYRVDYIKDRNGAHILNERMGMQREAGVGPMPLSPDSPKYGYLVRLNESSQNSEIEVLTTADLAGKYKPQPIWLPRDEYALSVSLNPREGKPYKAVFNVAVDGAGHLRVSKV